MPPTIWLFPYLRFHYRGRILYSCSEPNLLTTLFNGLLAKILGLKYVIFTWQNVIPEVRLHGWKLRVSNKLVWLNLRLATGVICGNTQAQQIVLQLAGEHAQELKTIVCPLSGVDTERFKPEIVTDWKNRLNLGTNEKLVLFYGALEVRKGLESLINAFKILVNNLSAKLVIVGVGPSKEALIQLVGKLNITDQVIFYDWMKNEELPALLKAADVFVYPSISSGGWEEQFGYAMAEASACAVPVIATQTGSISEVVLAGESGILVEPNQPQLLAAALVQILTDQNLAKQFGAYGRKYIMENFSHAVVAAKLEGFLQSL